LLAAAALAVRPALDLDQAISNGITGQATDGSGIQSTSGTSCGEDWRWVEQWLPHSAWYMVAITALAH
jgi:hypothetical protein